MKKILIYINSMIPAGGIERVVANLSNAWIKKYKVIIVVKDTPKSFYEVDKNIKIKSLNNPLVLNMDKRISRIYSIIRNSATTVVKLRKLLSELNPDYIYTTNPVNTLEIMLSGENSGKLVASEHGSIYGYNSVYNLLKKIIYPRVYKLSVPTRLDTTSYQNRKYPAVYIPHITTFNSNSRNNLQEKRILNIGRFTKDKQQQVLLSIWNKILSDEKFIDWTLVLVGKGEERSKLLEYIELNDLNRNVEVVEPIRNVEKYFKSVSLFAFTSRFEGFGMVLLEAMSFGIPCVSFNCPSGPRDIISDGKDGYLVEPNNEVEFTGKLKRLMLDINLRKEMGEAAFVKANGWDNNLILSEWDQIFSN